MYTNLKYKKEISKIYNKPSLNFLLLLFIIRLFGCVARVRTKVRCVIYQFVTVHSWVQYAVLISAL